MGNLTSGMNSVLTNSSISLSVCTFDSFPKNSTDKIEDFLGSIIWARTIRVTLIKINVTTAVSLASVVLFSLGMTEIVLTNCHNA